MEENGDILHSLGQEIESEHDRYKGHPEPDVTEWTRSAVPPPDGGWGWVVGFACFLKHVLTDGAFYSFGIIFIELLDFYQEDKGSTAVLASLSFGVCYLSGPLNAAMTNYFGFRKTTIFGTILMTTSLICSIFSPSIFYLYITFGISGWGLGLVYLSSIVCVTMYFEKRRAFAVGLGVSGSGIGTFIFGFLTRALIDNYSWKGVILIQSGLMLNCIACGLVYLPLTHEINTTNNQKDKVSAVSGFSNYNLKNKDMSDDVNGISYIEHREMNSFNNHSRSHASSSSTNVLHSNTDDVIIGSPSTEIIDYAKSHNKTEHIENSELSGEDRLSRGEHTAVPNVVNNKRFIDEIKSALKQSFNISVFKNMAYLLYILSTIFYSVGYYIPYIYLPDKAELSGVTISLTSVIVADLVGTDMLADAFGVMNFFAGISTFLGPPIAGWLFDVTRSYHMPFLVAGLAITLISFLYVLGWLFDITRSFDLPFLAAGIAITLSGAMLFLLPLMHKKQSPT